MDNGCQCGWIEENQAWINGSVNCKNQDNFKPLQWMWSPDEKCRNAENQEQRTVSCHKHWKNKCPFKKNFYTLQ